MGKVRVLVPSRGSLPTLRACRACTRLLAPGEADVRLLHVLSPELYPFPYDLEGELKPSLPEHVQQVTSLVAGSLTEPRKVFEQAGHTVELAHRYGNAAEEILTEIKDWKPDLVVMGRWWAHAPERWVRGSIFERVMRHADVPTLVVSYNPRQQGESSDGDAEEEAGGSALLADESPE